jgi:hypothetical protein
MAAPRLSDSQKSELVARFRAGESAQGLARAYGCSAATVSRTVRAALDPQEYERLKLPAGRRAAAADRAPSGTAEGADVLQGKLLEPMEPLEPLEHAADAEHPAAAEPMAAAAAEPMAATGAEADGEQADETPATLAIDDADDFGDEDLDEDQDDDEDDDDEDDSPLRSGSAAGSARSALAASLGLGAAAQAEPVPVQPLADARLPESAYLLVDKTVELQARPLSDFPELGLLDPDELERQALVVYLNPRQAKRQCGRSQRVIKIPDLAVLERTSRFLLSQGISRLVIEGSLYSLSGS